jgi:hypothetical protein
LLQPEDDDTELEGWSKSVDVEVATFVMNDDWNDSHADTSSGSMMIMNDDAGVVMVVGFADKY